MIRSRQDLLKNQVLSRFNHSHLGGRCWSPQCQRTEIHSCLQIENVMIRKLPVFAVVILLYVCCITVACGLYFWSMKKQQLAQVDRTLVAAAGSLETATDQAMMASQARNLLSNGLLDGVFLWQSEQDGGSWQPVFVPSGQTAEFLTDLIDRPPTSPAPPAPAFVHPDKHYGRVIMFSHQPSAETYLLLVDFKPHVRGILTTLLYMVLFAVVFALTCVPLVMHYRAKQQELIQAVMKAAHTDTLTGLPNKQQLLIDLAATKTPNLAFIKILNYNSFIINYGPAVVSDIIRQFAAVLSRFHDPRLVESCAYRVEPATFAILEDQDIAAREIADITAEIVKSLMLYEYQIGDGEHARINVVVGGVNQKEDAYTLAKMALQEAEHNKLPYYFINKDKSSLPAQYRKDQQLLREVLGALNEQRLKAYYHPIFAADGRTVVKYECLARIVDQAGEVIMMPDVFLPLAHRANVYYRVTRAVVEQAIDFALRNQVLVSVNINVSDINNKKTRAFIYQSLQESEVGALLEFELLEDEAIINTSRVIKFMLKIQKLGAKIGMDDLGKGYSNIERLLNLPIDFVKIDKSIMENLTHNLEMQSIAKSIIRLAHKKNLKVTAEYCADKIITQMAVDLGADYLQGYYLARPSKDMYQDIMAPKSIHTH